MYAKFNDYWSKWARQRALSIQPQSLDSGNLYILPSRFGWAFAIVLLTLFLSAINYQVSAVFFLVFLLAIAGLVSAWEAHFNMKGLAVECLTIDDAWEGGNVKVILVLNKKRALSYALQYQFPHQEPLILEKFSGENIQISLSLPAEKRGCFKLPRITFSSYFPFGLFRVWGYIYFDTDYYVYPKSIDPGFWPQSAKDIGTNAATIAGNEEIYDLKPVLNPWTQPGRIAWKIAARGQGWYLKTMVSSEGNYWVFRLQDLPATHLEENLQHLCYWLQKAEKEGYFYGLELKGAKSELSQGPIHLTHCLRQLATY